MELKQKVDELKQKIDHSTWWIGIDVGTHTGLAIWNSKDQKFEHLGTYKLWEALEEVKEFVLSHNYDVCVVVEDARKRKWYGQNPNAKMQGAGSVKRDSKIWQEFLEDNMVKHYMIAPIKGCTKWTPEHFQSITGWKGRTSEHARDAGLMVFGR